MNCGEVCKTMESAGGDEPWNSSGIDGAVAEMVVSAGGGVKDLELRGAA